MPNEEKLEQLIQSFAQLSSQEQQYILGVAQALSFSQNYHTKNLTEETNSITDNDAAKNI